MTRATLLIAIAAPLICMAQDADHVPTFRSDVNLVKVDVQVTTADGRNIGDLDQQDFIVYDEGQRVPVLHFGREREPLSILLLLDVSGSMSKSLSALASATGEALGHLHSGDQVGVMVFSERSAIVQPFTTDFDLVRRQIVSSIYQNTTGEGTKLNEALADAADLFADLSPKGRRAILVVTDNQSLRFGVKDRDVLAAADRAGATINAIVVGPQPDTATRARMKPAYYADPQKTRPDVFAYAKQTGGEAMQASDMAESFPKIVESIRTRYFLDYSAPEAQAGAHRAIRVELSPAATEQHPHAAIQARTGYYVSR